MKRDKVILCIITAISFVAALLLSATIWFAAPLLAFGEFAPFERSLVRVTLIALLWLVLLGYLSWRFLRARHAEATLERAVKTTDTVNDDGAQLSERMTDAIATLKKTFPGRNFLYELPWYLIIGPPGTGKTTALVNSGLKFPLSSDGSKHAIAGVGGTRYCDWWFSEDAVLIDTAGRYTTQDSNEASDRKSWLSFVSLLKAQRQKQPINGVIIAISIQDLLTLTPAERGEHAAAIRKRLLELYEILKVDFPVYALFTKADLIAGFNEYFGAFPEERRRQVWGATFQSEDRKKNFVDQVPHELDDLVMRLGEVTADRLQAEPDPVARILAFGFPAQVAALREPIAAFLSSIFEPTRYHARAQLRGFYFASGNQQGTPIDQMLGAMGAEFGSATSAYMSATGKSYFIHDLFTKVIFPEAGWVSKDMGAVRRATSMRVGMMAATALLTVGLSAGFVWSFAKNRQLVASTNSTISDYRSGDNPALSLEPINDTDLQTILAPLHQLRNMEAGYANRDQSSGWLEGLGLSQRGRLNSAAQEAYRAALERTLRARLILRLERQIEDGINDPVFIYEALKVYLMLGGKAPKTDDDLVLTWMRDDWNSFYPGPSNRSTREELDSHLQAMLALDDTHNPEVALNGTLVEAAQKTLTRMSVSDRAYTFIKSASLAEGLSDWRLDAKAGTEPDRVFETMDGQGLDTIRVPGLFTYAGFHDFFLNELGAVADNLIAEQWVLGEVGEKADVEAQLSRLGPELLEKYRQDFIASWEDALAKFRLKRMSADKPQYTALRIIAGSSSPIVSLFQSISDETRLTEERDEPESDGNEALTVAASKGKNLAAQRLESRVSAWSRIGIDVALGKSQKQMGKNGSEAQIPGASIEAYFRPYHQLVEGDEGKRPIDMLIETLSEISRTLLVADTPSQLGKMMAVLPAQIADLKKNISRLPPPLAKMMESAVGDFEGDAAGSTIAQLNQELNDRVTRVCQAVIDNRYPFSAKSERDVPLADFVRLFGPAGAIDKFFDEKLSQLVDMNGSDWSWKKADRVGQDLSNATLLEFQRAAQIRDAFFPSGSPMLALQMKVKPQSLSGSAEYAILVINGTVVQSRQMANPPVDVTWPGPGEGAASISLYPQMAGRKSDLAQTGQWAFLRLLNEGSVSPSGDAINARFVIGGREVSYQFELGQINNPFLLPALSEFKCPMGL